MDSFSPRQVCELCGISYRQVQYWDTSKFLPPSRRSLNGQRRYDLLDLVLVKLMAVFRKSGFSLQELRPILPQARALFEAYPSYVEATFLYLEGRMFLAKNREFCLSGDWSKAVCWDVGEFLQKALR